MSLVTHLECSLTSERYAAGRIHNLSRAGKPLLVRYDLEAAKRTLTRDSLAEREPGMWKWRELLSHDGDPVSLGEPETPIVPLRKTGGANLLVKDEGRLPTGSFKARGLAMAVTMAREFGIERIAMPTNGNAGAALAAYGARAEIETEVLRKIGADGVVVMASVSPCRPALVVNPPGSTTPPGVSADAAPPPTTPCSEADANTVTLCATIPDKATVSEIQLFARATESDEPWSTHRLMPGQEANQARFAAQPLEKPDGPGMKQVCQGFSLWAAQQSRVARMVVRYSL